ncbi:MAG: hypothetical protein SPK70_06670 [Succinivibrio dextrinosolvens]|nr:hypothetical protein [Succinivibrio dextrinosolvens]
MSGQKQIIMIGIWFIGCEHAMSNLVAKINFFNMKTTVREQLAENTADTGYSIRISTAAININYLFESSKVVFKI